MPFTDKQLVCKDCTDPFVYSASEQEHHAKLGLRNEPRRCVLCRQSARMRKEDRMGSGFRPPPGAGRGGFGARPPGPPRPREFFEVTCGQCGRPAQVPFKPRGDRPVLCRDCFRR